MPLRPIVERFTSSGIDARFGDHGTNALDDGTTPDGLSVALALQPDGKILAADVDLYRTG